jgi:beta-glucosidase
MIIPDAYLVFDPTPFPTDFLWGAASSSYQIEGAAEADGKGLSVCDTFYRNPANGWEGDNGDVACDHYHRWEEDLDLMKSVGLQAYRFSVNWSRVLPEGVGRINETGLAFYDKLVDGLLERGIEPYLTLFHWEYPQALQERGGWLNDASPDWFAEYAGLLARRLGDRVTNWMTLNEPQIVIMGGHRSGRHAPGLRVPIGDQVLVAHNMLKAHGAAVQALRANAPQPIRIGAAPVGVVRIPETESAADIDAARTGTFAITEDTFWNNTWFADPMFLGKYPEDGLRIWGSHLPPGWEDDMEGICQPLDFYGANIYNGQRVRAADGGWEPTGSDPGPALTTMDWKVSEESLYYGPKFLHERYGLPILITENGMANTDWVQVDGRVRDSQRIDFLIRYLGQLERAVKEGVPVDGYLHWCWSDNFEWYLGYSRRFGLVHVDFRTQQRMLKDSARWYAELIRRHSRTG